MPMKWEFAAYMIGLALVILLAGVALQGWTRHRGLGALLVGVGLGVLVQALIAPWSTR